VPNNWLACGVLALALPGCGPGESTATDALLPYLEAVQSQNLDRLYCLSAGASTAPELGRDGQERRDNFDLWALPQYEIYLDQRDLGRVELEDNPIRVVKLYSLGRGTFFDYGTIRPVGDGAIEVETRLRFGYPHLDLSRYPPGTTLYMCAAPAGRVKTVRVPALPTQVREEVLESVTVLWTLVREPAGGGCPGGWTVVSAATVPGSEKTTEVVWEF
jgi:hypothetical protein